MQKSIFYSKLPYVFIKASYLKKKKINVVNFSLINKHIQFTRNYKNLKNG